MANLFKSIFIGIIFSCYFFPFEFAFLPGINTKMVLAVIGLMLLAVQWAKEKSMTTAKDMLVVSVWAAVFSLFSFFSVTYNNTTDYAYATYIVSMWVWLSGAYAVLSLIRVVHGRISIQLVFHYMAWVCAAQSVLGIVIDNVPSIQSIVDEYILQDIQFLHKTNRLYGIGASFDTAGIRFSCALLGLSYLLTHNVSRYWNIVYWMLFAVIAVLGNIMSRTTTVGLLLAVVYIIIKNFSFNIQLTASKLRMVTTVIIVAFGLSIFLYYGYNHLPMVKYYMEYGFEAFFNYANSGEFTTSSTDKLQLMVVWPDNIKTWLIGDGWFDNPNDPGSFYKYTDVGYLRLIFYCGSIGLAIFMLFFAYCTYALVRKWRGEALLFTFMFVLALVVWVKISTDIFCVYVLLMLLEKQGDSIQEKLFSDTSHDTQENTLLLAERRPVS